MKRAGFTMIELVFVIVILGILAAVALPKFMGVSQQAHDQKVKAFVGTLNRTVGPSIWATVADGNGSISHLCTTTFSSYFDSIPEVTQSGCNFSKNTANGGVYDINFTDGNASQAPRWTYN